MRSGDSLVEAVGEGPQIIIEQARVNVQVTLADACPRARWAALIDAPEEIINEAAVARRSWIRNCGSSPQTRSAGFQTFCRKLVDRR